MKKIGLIVFSFLLFAGSLDAQARGLIEEDHERGRIHTSVRLKFEVLKEFFLPSCSLLLENGREESFAIPSHDTDSQRIDSGVEGFPMDTPLYAERDEEGIPLAKVQTMELNIDEMTPEWWDKYLRGLPGKRQLQLLKSYENQLANFDPDRNTVSMEIIDEKERASIGAILKNEKTGECVQVKYLPLNEEGKLRMVLRYWNPDGQVLERIVKSPSVKKLNKVMDHFRSYYHGADTLKAFGVGLAGIAVLAVGGFTGIHIDSNLLAWSSMIGGGGLSLWGMFGAKSMVDNKHAGIYEEHIRHLLDENQAGNTVMVSRHKFLPIILFLSKKLFKKIRKEDQ